RSMIGPFKPVTVSGILVIVPSEGIGFGASFSEKVRPKPSDQEFNVPESPPTPSVTVNVQVPFGEMPLNALNSPCGRNRPVNGGEPLVIAVAAWSSRMVFVKLAPATPTPENSVILELFGPVKLTVRSLSYV